MRAGVTINGKIISGFIVGTALIVGAAVYYLQVYAYYSPVAATGQLEITAVDGSLEPLMIENFQGIDADSSPLRYRACFTVPVSLATMSESFEIAENADPLNGPGWFSCYNATEVGEALASGDAVAFVGQHDIRPGIDRIIAVMRDGRGFAWHQLNASAED